jgi:hypothetical protein
VSVSEYNEGKAKPGASLGRKATDLALYLPLKAVSGVKGEDRRAATFHGTFKSFLQVLGGTK